MAATMKSAQRCGIWTARCPVVPFRSRGAVKVQAAQSDRASTSNKRDLLLRELQLCIKEEDFKRASIIKGQLQEIEANDPVLVLQKALKEAVAQERYKDAAKLQAELKALQSQTPVDLVADLEHLGTTSDVSTHDIRVKVKSFYVPGNSIPAHGQYLFGYHITIINESNRVVQLRNRHWVILDEEGRKEEVRGPGVVGAQPVLLPGKSYEYSSGCPLRTPTGSMEGEYQFVVLDETDGRFKDVIDVAIGRFKLSAKEGPMAA